VTQKMVIDNESDCRINQHSSRCSKAE